MESEFGLRVIVEAITECHVQTECHENGSWILSPNSETQEMRTRNSPSLPLWFGWMMLSVQKERHPHPAILKPANSDKILQQIRKFCPTLVVTILEAVFFSADCCFFPFFLHRIMSKMEKNNNIFALKPSLTCSVEPAKHSVLFGSEATHRRQNHWSKKKSSQRLVKELKAYTKVAEAECKPCCRVIVLL